MRSLSMDGFSFVTGYRVVSVYHILYTEEIKCLPIAEKCVKISQYSLRQDEFERNESILKKEKGKAVGLLLPS